MPLASKTAVKMGPVTGALQQGNYTCLACIVTSLFTSLSSLNSVKAIAKLQWRPSIGTPPPEKCIFGKCCLWPWPLNHDLENVISIMWIRYWVTVTSFIKIRPRMIHAVIVPKWLFDHMVSLWPWPLTFWPQNVSSSALSTTAPKL